MLRRPLADATGAALLAALLLGAAGCGRDGGTPEARAASASPAGGPGAGGPGGGAAAGPSVVLSAGDVATVSVAPIEAATPITGDLKPIEEVMVRARLEGNLEQVLVREGDRVRAGQLLARFESFEEEGNRASAEADRAAAESDVATAKWNADQSAELFTAGAISEQANRAAQQAYVAAKARLAAADARLRSTGRVVADTRVLSPTDGVVSQRLVESGEHVSRGATLLSVVRNDRLELQADVPARQANEIRPGQPVRFAADGLPLEGQVARVSPTVNPATRAVAVYVQVANPGGRLKGNTFATGRIIGRTIPDALVVPVAAVRQGSGDAPPFVYRIDGATLARVNVRTGVVDDLKGIVQVVEGLSAGDRVIVGNVGAVGTGARVQILGEPAAAAVESGREDSTATRRTAPPS